MLFTACEKEEAAVLNPAQGVNSASRDFEDKQVKHNTPQEAMAYMAEIQGQYSKDNGYKSSNDNFENELVQVEYALNNVLGNIPLANKLKGQSTVKIDTITFELPMREDGTISILDKIKWINHHTQSALELSAINNGKIYALDLQHRGVNIGSGLQQITTLVLTLVANPRLPLEETCGYSLVREWEQLAIKIENVIRICDPVLDFAFYSHFEVLNFQPDVLENDELSWNNQFYNSPNWLPYERGNPNRVFFPEEQEARVNGIKDMFNNHDGRPVQFGFPKNWDSTVLQINALSNDQPHEDDWIEAIVLYYNNVGPRRCIFC